jgi:hypothetical protein
MQVLSVINKQLANNQFWGVGYGDKPVSVPSCASEFEWGQLFQKSDITDVIAPILH